MYVWRPTLKDGLWSFVISIQSSSRSKISFCIFLSLHKKCPGSIPFSFLYLYPPTSCIWLSLWIIMKIRNTLACKLKWRDQFILKNTQVPVNTQKVFTTSYTPLYVSFVHFSTIFPLKTLKITLKSLQKAIKPSKKPPKGLKCLQKAKKPLFSSKNIQNSSKIAKIPKREEKI